MTIAASISAPTINASGGVGFVSVNVANGSAQAVANLSLSLTEPAGSGRITVADLAAGAATVRNFVSLAVSGSASTTLPLASPLLGGTLPTFQAHWPDLSDPTSFTANTQDFADILSYQGITSAAFSFGIDTLTAFLDKAVDDPLGGANPLQISLPLAHKSLAQLIDLKTLLNDTITKYTATTVDPVTASSRSRSAPATRC